MQPTTGVKAGAWLLLTEISNATGDPQLNATADVLRVQLAQSAHFNLLENDRVKETLQRMTKPADTKLDVPVAREVAYRSGTPLLVYGTLSPLGAGYGLTLVMERIEGQPRTAQATESKLFEARSKNGLFDVTRPRRGPVGPRARRRKISRRRIRCPRRPRRARGRRWITTRRRSG